MEASVLKVRGVKTHFPVQKGFFPWRTTQWVKAVDGVSLELQRGQTLGLVGESGCGKSSLARTLMRLNQVHAGTIELCGSDITHTRGSELARQRQSCQMIFQDPYASLNPRLNIFDIIAEPIRTHQCFRDFLDLQTQVRQLIEVVGLPLKSETKYPHEFSGGQRQRIAIARAIAIRPKVIICDEPVSALDVSIQAQIINLLMDLQKEYQLAYLFIAHDIAVVKHISHQVAVMYLGKIVEIAPTKEIFANPKHPYTQALLSCVPVLDPRVERVRKPLLLQGDLPSPLNPPIGCAFRSRCPQGFAQCQQQPALSVAHGSGWAQHKVACHLVSPH